MTDWWRGAAIYQIYPRSFQDSDGDGIGDLPGILKRLPHVASLGVDAIWISPVFPSPMADMGYDVSDYCGIDPMFGTLADFDALLARAHDLGLRVIIDLVLNHTSDRHPWFAESRASRTNPRADWYVWADPLPDGSPPNNWPSHFGGPAWEWEPRRRQYYLHNFLASQPDLNVHNPQVRAALLDVMRFWLERGVDGFRLDTVNYYHHDPRLRSNPPAPPAEPAPADIYGMQIPLHSKTQPENLPFLEEMRALTDRYEARAMVGEVGESGRRAIEIMAEYTEGERRLHMAYSFDMLGAAFTPDAFRSRLETFYRLAPDAMPCWSFSNHDVVRHATRWADHDAGDGALARQAAALLASFPGAIGLYQAEELGQTETELSYDELTDPPALRFWPEIKGRDGCRTPMPWQAKSPNAGFSTARPWLPVKPPQAARAVDLQEADPASVLHAYRRILAFRQASPSLRHGPFRFHDLPDPLLALDRGTGAETLTAVFNLSTAPQTVTLSVPATLAGPGTGSLDGTTLHLPPNGFAWLAPVKAPLTLSAP